MKTISKFFIHAVTLFFFLVSFILISCHSSKQKTQEKIMEEAIENASGQKTKADINGEKVTLEGEYYKAELNAKGGRWSGEIPKDVPEFNFGKIEHSTVSEAEGTKSWSFVFKEIPEEVIGKYEALLKKNGFETTKMTMGKGGSITGEKNNIVVSVIWSKEMTHVSVQVNSGKE